VIDFEEGLKKHLFAAADVFVSLATTCRRRSDNRGRSACRGLPVIASDFDGYKDTVTEEVGVLLPTRWTHSLENSLIWLLYSTSGRSTCC